MLEKCTLCGRPILAGGEPSLGNRFCSEYCALRFNQAMLVDELLPSEVVADQVSTAFSQPCPQCCVANGNDVYSATKVTGMLFGNNVQSYSKICCSACGRKNCLAAALHCLVLGWWDIEAAFINLFVLPTNLICLFSIRQPTEPSAILAAFVKAGMADLMQNELAAASAEAGKRDRE